MKKKTGACSRCGDGKRPMTLNLNRKHCDVGLKSVLRKIRKLLIEEIQSSANTHDILTSNVSSADICKEICVSFFLAEVDLASHKGAPDHAQIYLLMQTMLDALTHEKEEEIIKILRRQGCKNKRYTRMSTAQVQAAVGSSEIPSPFGCFNQDIITHLSFNIYFHAFCTYLCHFRFQLQDHFSGQVLECRKRAFDHILNQI